MKGYTRLPKRHLYLIISVLGILIFLLSMEIMMKVKDMNIFNDWLNDNKQYAGTNTTKTELFNIYVSMNLSMYFQKIIVPMALGIHTYLSYTKIRINKLFVFIWTALLIGSVLYTIVGLENFTIFTYMYIVLYIIVIFTILSLLTVIDKSEKS